MHVMWGCALWARICEPFVGMCCGHKGQKYLQKKYSRENYWHLLVPNQRALLKGGDSLCCTTFINVKSEQNFKKSPASSVVGPYTLCLAFGGHPLSAIYKRSGWSSWLKKTSHTQNLLVLLTTSAMATGSTIIGKGRFVVRSYGTANTNSDKTNNDPG